MSTRLRILQSILDSRRHSVEPLLESGSPRRDLVGKSGSPKRICTCPAATRGGDFGRCIQSLDYQDGHSGSDHFESEVGGGSRQCSAGGRQRGIGSGLRHKREPGGDYRQGRHELSFGHGGRPQDGTGRCRSATCSFSLACPRQRVQGRPVEHDHADDSCSERHASELLHQVPHVGSSSPLAGPHSAPLRRAATGQESL